MVDANSALRERREILQPCAKLEIPPSCIAEAAEVMQGLQARFNGQIARAARLCAHSSVIVY